MIEPDVEAIGMLVRESLYWVVGPVFSCGAYVWPLNDCRHFSKNTVLKVGILPAKSSDLFTCYARHP